MEQEGPYFSPSVGLAVRGRPRACQHSPVAGALENERTIAHPGNAVVKALTFSLDAREPHERAADYTEQTIKVYLGNATPSNI
jgi:hypothetical protein